MTGCLRPRRPRWFVAATVSILAVTLFLQPLAAQEIPCEFQAARRIVAIGDVHGAYDTFIEVLARTGLVDEDLGWIGGSTHLVQTGDVLDRGPDSRKVLDLLIALEPKAAAAGGRVHVLIGNHEFWNAVGMLGYVSEGELAAFTGRRDDALRRELGGDAAPPGVLALREAYGARGEYGKWLRARNAAIRIGDVVFVHGGITPEVAGLGLSELNRRVRRDLDSESWAQSFSLGDDGPLMTRRYSSDDLMPLEMEALGPDIAKALELLDARLMVMGHTVTFGLVEPRFDGRAILIDTGMLDLYLGGRGAALVLEGDERYAVYANGTVKLPARLDSDEGHRYVEAVFNQSPGDRGLAHWLATVRYRQGRLAESAELHRTAGVLDPAERIPYAWSRDAAHCFDALGKDREKEEAYGRYLDGLAATAEGMGPSGIVFLERYARECLRLGRIDDAFDAAQRLTSSAPKNLSYKEILARAYIEKGDSQRAVRVLLGAQRLGSDGFELHFLLGRAQLGLGRNEEALEAFLSAQRLRPGDPDVAEALARLKAGVK